MRTGKANSLLIPLISLLPLGEGLGKRGVAGEVDKTLSPTLSQRARAGKRRVIEVVEA
jgi:hypothetical protein